MYRAYILDCGVLKQTFENDNFVLTVRAARCIAKKYGLQWTVKRTH